MSENTTAEPDREEQQNSAADAGSESPEEGAQAQAAADDAVIDPSDG